MTTAQLKRLGLTVLADERVDRAAWLEARRHVITATQAAVIAGGHPYSSIIDVWNDKTDPAWIEEPNRYLDERATLGRSREAEIIRWASEELGVKLTPNSALLTADSSSACTPDAYAVVPYNGAAPMGPRLTILDAKTTQQNWHTAEDYAEGGSRFGQEPIAKPTGVPQHVTDQMLWTFRVTSAERIWLAVEQYTWSKGVPQLVDSYLLEVQRDDVRLAFIEERVADFENLLEQEIAPESDIDIRELRATDPWDLSPEDAADREALIAADDAMTERGEILDRIEKDTARVAELEAIIKAAPKVYAGRRVWLIGERFIAKLVRSYRVNVDQSKLDPRQVAAARSWSEVETVKIEPSPEWTPPAATETEQESTAA